MKKRRWRLVIVFLLLLFLLSLGLRYGLGYLRNTEEEEEILEEEQENLESSLKLSVISEIKMTKDPRDNFDEIFAGDNLVIYYEKGELKAMDLSNKELWTRKFDPELILGKNVARVLVVEKNKGNVYHIANDGEIIGSVLGLGEIDSASLSQDNKTLLFFRDNRRVVVLDEYLNKTADIVVDNGAIINYSVSTKLETLNILTLEEQEGELISRLYVYSMEGRVIQSRRESMLALNIYSSDRDSLIVYQRGIQFYDENFEPREDFISTNKVVYSTKEGFHLYLVTGSANHLDEEGELEFSSYSLSSRKLEFTNKISDTYDNIYARGGMVLASYKNTLDLYDLHGNLLHSEILDFPIKKAMLLDEEKLAVFDGSRFTLFKIEF